MWGGKSVSTDNEEFTTNETAENTSNSTNPNKQNKNSNKKVFYKKWWFWVIIAVVAVIIIGAAAGSADGNGGDEIQDYENVNSSEAWYICDNATNSSDIVFKVNSVQNTQLVGSGILSETTSNNFAIVNISIRNNSDKPFSANPNNFNLVLNGKKYSYHSATYYLDNGMSSLDDINPGITKTYRIVFEVPTSTLNDTYTLVCGNNYSLLWKDIEILLKERS